MTDEPELDLLTYMRRLAISSADDVVAALETAQSSPLRTFLLQDDPLLSMVKLAEKQHGLRLHAEKLWAEFDTASSSALASLDKATAEVPRHDAAALAVVDDTLLRIMEAKRPAVTGLLLDALELSPVLPMLSTLVSELNRELDRIVVVATQHLLGSTVAQFNALNELGIPYENMFILGKPYSSNRAVSLYLRRLGATVHESSLELSDPAIRYHDEYERSLGGAAGEILQLALHCLRSQGRGRRLLVLDDGGLLLQEIHRVARARKAISVELRGAVGVEQTTGGLRKMQRLGKQLRFPIVNVATSHAKLSRESPHIADSIVAEVDARLRRIHPGSILTGRRVLVIGYGAVGRWVVTRIREAGGQPTVYDTDSRKITLARAEAADAVESLEEAVTNQDMIIGCSGEPGFEDNPGIVLEDDTLLVSASSSNVEFRGMPTSAWSAHQWAWTKHLFQRFPPSAVARVHADYRITSSGRDVWLANGGFPVNFTGDVDPIKPSIIQLTRSLMFVGSLQALESADKPPSVLKLDKRLNKLVISMFDRLTANDRVGGVGSSG